MSSYGDGLLHYGAHAVAVMAPRAVPSGEPTVLRFGTAAEGGHAYSVLVPMRPGPGAVGLHFQQGQLGLLYHPLHDRYPFHYLRTSHDEFRAAVLRDHGLNIQGPVVS